MTEEGELTYWTAGYWTTSLGRAKQLADKLGAKVWKTATLDPSDGTLVYDGGNKDGSWKAAAA